MINCPWCGAEPFDHIRGWQCGSWKDGEDVMQKDQSLLCKVWELRKRNVKLEALKNLAVEWRDKSKWEPGSERKAFRYALDALDKEK